MNFYCWIWVETLYEAMVQYEFGRPTPTVLLPSPHINKLTFSMFEN